jgi:acetyl esterase/lipase
MSKFAISLLKPFVRALKFSLYDKEKAWFRIPIRGKIRFGAPSIHRNVNVEHTEINGIKTGIFTPENPVEKKIVLYLHGGGFTVCNYKMYAHLINAIAAKSNIICYAIDYRLAPEDTFPSGVDDCVAFFQYLKEKFPDTEIYLGGDSAGGGLVFSTALKLKQEGKVLPAKLFAFSPWVDLSISSPTYEKRGSADPLIDKDSAKKWALRYLNGHDATDPIASPVYGNFSNFPSVFLHVGKDEVLLGDSQMLFEKLKKHQVEITYKEWEGMMHVFQIFYPLLDEAKQSLDELSSFLKK